LGNHKNWRIISIPAQAASAAKTAAKIPSSNADANPTQTQARIMSNASSRNLGFISTIRCKCLTGRNNTPQGPRRLVARWCFVGRQADASRGYGDAVSRPSRQGLPIMTSTDLFWQYAEEATLAARHSKNEAEKRAMLDLARTWTQAALESEGTLFALASLEEIRAAKAASNERDFPILDK
jgi:hypothetical protein